jgi:AcrR family transcriptional regulator
MHGQRRQQIESQENGREAIVFAAADCFMAAGYNATSIDAVADRLKATKGRVYHYYRSKTDLFFDVHRRAMAINFAAIEPHSCGPGKPGERLAAMCRSHLAAMLDYRNFQLVLLQGVEMHLYGATTPAQRATLAELMGERERYEGLFRKVLIAGKEAGEFDFAHASFASKAVLAVLNNPILWYRRREGDAAASRKAIIDQFTQFALNTVAAHSAGGKDIRS